MIPKNNVLSKDAAPDVFVTELHDLKNKTVKVSLSDGSSFNVGFETAESYSLKPGKILTNDVEEILYDSNLKQAKSSALNMLSFSNRTRAMLKERLLKKYAEEIADTVLNEFESSGLINDREYAYSFALTCIRSKFWGDSRVFRELKLRGVSEEDAEYAVSLASEDGFSETQRLEMLFEKKYRSINSEKDRKRVFDALIRLGYRFGDIKNILNIINEEMDEQ